MSDNDPSTQPDSAAADAAVAENAAEIAEEAAETAGMASQVAAEHAGLAPGASLGTTEADVGISDAPAETTAAHDPSEVDAMAGQSSSAGLGRGGRKQPENLALPPHTSLYIGNLFFETTEQSLRQEFEPFGEIVTVRIAKDPRGLSRGFGFVQFTENESAARAVENKDQRILNGRRMAVQFHTPRERPQHAHPPPKEPSKTLFIGNMSFEMSDRDLNDLFRDLRNVLDVRVAIDRRTGQPRGFAHADFLDVQSAQEAYELLKEKSVYGRRLRVDFSTPSTANKTAADVV